MSLLRSEEHDLRRRNRLTICHLQVVQCLIEKGSNIEVRDDYHETPLHIACENGHLPIVQYLIDKGANMKHELHSEKYERTLLHIASSNCHLQVQCLVEKGATIEAKFNVH